MSRLNRWSSDMDKVLIEWVGQKKTMAEIGERLGVTRHSVWGRCRRLRLAGQL